MALPQLARHREGFRLALDAMRDISAFTELKIIAEQAIRTNSENINGGADSNSGSRSSSGSSSSTSSSSSCNSNSKNKDSGSKSAQRSVDIDPLSLEIITGALYFHHVHLLGMFLIDFLSLNELQI